MHILLLGMTGQGKTSEALELIKAYKAQRLPVAVLTPKRDDVPRYRAAGADLVTMDRNLFLKVVRSDKSRKVMVFVDEGGQTIGRYNPEMEALLTDARHNANTVHIIAHRWTGQVNRTVLEQCTKLICFRLGMRDAKNLVADWGHPELIQVPKLLPMEFMYCTTTAGSLKRGHV